MIAHAHDAAWGGWGQAVCDENGPIHAAWTKIGRRAWRWDALRLDLGGLSDLAHQIAAERQDVARVVVEAALPNARRTVNGRPRNQVQTSHALGQLYGVIMLEGARRAAADGWGYPWGVSPADWRAWWGWPAGGPNAKSAAVSMVHDMGWGAHLAAHGTDPHGRCGDVAEAILIGVGACRNAKAAPVGPDRYRQIVGTR